MKCLRCGGKVRRVHRTFLEHFQYLAIYECVACDTEQCMPRPYQYHLGPLARCPRCGTFRVSPLKERDHIDAMRGGPVNFLKRMSGGKLFHCRYCRLQFYDRRPLGPEPGGTPAGPESPELDAA
jgi:transcription elongation factor Elf1